MNTTYCILLEAAPDYQDGVRWFLREATSPEEAVSKLVADLGGEAAGIRDVQVIEISEGRSWNVSQQTRWVAGE